MSLTRRDFLKMSVFGALLGPIVGCDMAEVRKSANNHAQYEDEYNNLFIPFIRETQPYYLVSSESRFNEEWKREHMRLGFATTAKGDPTIWVEYEQKNEEEDALEAEAHMNQKMTCYEISELGDKQGTKIVSFAGGRFKFLLKRKAKIDWTKVKQSILDVVFDI